MKVFLSYRRDDSAAYAGRLRDTLAAQLGANNTFLDVSTIKIGEDFQAATGRALDAADVELVVIGPRWLALQPDGTSRLSDLGDYVRMEVLHALDRDVPVVPVLVAGADIPKPSEVPDELQPLLRCQAVRLRDESWHEDVSALLRHLSGPEQDVPARPRRWVIVAGIAAVAVAAGGVLYGLRGENDTSDTVGACDGLPLSAAADSSWTALNVPADHPETTIDAADGSVGYTATDAYYRATEPGHWLVGIKTIKHSRDRPPGESHGNWDYTKLLVNDLVAAEGVTCFEASPTVLNPGESGRAVVGFDATEDPTSGPLTLEVETQSDSGDNRFDPVPVT